MGKLVEGAEKQVHALRNVAAEADRAVQSRDEDDPRLSGNLATTTSRLTCSRSGRGTGPDYWRSEAEKIACASCGNRRVQATPAQLRSAAPPRNEDEERGKEANWKRSINSILPAARNKSRRIWNVSSVKPFAEAAVQSSANWKQRQDAEGEYENILKSEIALHQELQTAEDRRAKSASARAAEQEKHVTGMRDAMKAYIADMELFDKKGRGTPGSASARSKWPRPKGLVPLLRRDDGETARRCLPICSASRIFATAVAGGDGRGRDQGGDQGPVRFDQTLARLNAAITNGVGKIKFGGVMFEDPRNSAGMSAEEKFKYAEESITRWTKVHDTTAAFDAEHTALAEIAKAPGNQEGLSMAATRFLKPVWS